MEFHREATSRRRLLMDPISIAASVLGVLQISNTLSISLYDFTVKIRRPKNLALELSNLQRALKRLATIPALALPEFDINEPPPARLAKTRPKSSALPGVPRTFDSKLEDTRLDLLQCTANRRLGTLGGDPHLPVGSRDMVWCPPLSMFNPLGANRYG